MYNIFLTSATFPFCFIFMYTFQLPKQFQDGRHMGAFFYEQSNSSVFIVFPINSNRDFPSRSCPLKESSAGNKWVVSTSLQARSSCCVIDPEAAGSWGCQSRSLGPRSLEGNLSCISRAATFTKQATSSLTCSTYHFFNLQVYLICMYLGLLICKWW